MIKKIIVFFFQLLLIGFLTLVARELWIAYQEEKLSLLFEKEGRPVTVRITGVSHEKKNWKDHLGISEYFLFRFQEKPYTVRYVLQPRWTGVGDTVRLLYDANLDVFRQPGLHAPAARGLKPSRLFEWTIVSTFTLVHLFFFFAVVITCVVLLFSVSLLATLTGWRLLQGVADGLGVVFALALAIFFSWDALRHYQYYYRVKSGGQSVTVPVTDKIKHSLPNSHSDNFPVFYYSARVQFHQEYREIPISSDDYSDPKTAKEIAVIYAPSMDEMMAADYSPGPGTIIFPVAVWIIVLTILFSRKKAVNPKA